MEIETIENEKSAGKIRVEKDDLGDYHVSCDAFQHPDFPEWGTLALVHEGVKETAEGKWEFHVYLERAVIYVDAAGLRHSERMAWLPMEDLLPSPEGRPRIERNRFARKLAAQRRQAAAPEVELREGVERAARRRGRPPGQGTAESTAFGVELRSDGFYAYRHGTNDPATEKGPFKLKLEALTYIRRQR